MPLKSLGCGFIDQRYARASEFEVLNGNASLVERCEVGVKAVQLTDLTEPI